MLDATGTTSGTLADNAQTLDSLLTGVIGLSRSGIDLIGPNQGNLIKAVDVFESTAQLLMKYNPTFTCTLVGAKTALDSGYLDATGGANRKSLILDSAPLLGPDAYRYPQNLPVIGAKGGPGGKPGCGSLPDVAANWPVRQLITNTGWGTGLDIRPNPGIAFPGYADYFPSPGRYPNRPASAIRAVLHRDRSRTPARRPMGPRYTPRTERRCGPGCRRRRRRARHGNPARRHRARNLSWCPRPRNCNPRQHHRAPSGTPP